MDDLPLEEKFRMIDDVIKELQKIVNLNPPNIDTSEVAS